MEGAGVSRRKFKPAEGGGSRKPEDFRNLAPATSPPFAAPWVPVRIICTGRRRHGRHVFGVVGLHPSEPLDDMALRSHRTRVGAGYDALMRGEPLAVDEATRSADHWRYEFVCPRCAAAHRLTADNLGRATQGVVEHGGRVLDLSALGAANLREE